MFSDLSGPTFFLVYVISLLLLVGVSEIVRNALLLSSGNPNAAVPERIEQKPAGPEPAPGRGADAAEGTSSLMDDLAAIASKYGDYTPIRTDLNYRPNKPAPAKSVVPPLPGGLVPSEVGYLQAGRQRAYLAALTQLVLFEDLSVNAVTNRLELVRTMPSVNGIIEMAIFKAVPKYGATLESVYTAIDGPLNELHKKLASKGFLASKQLIQAGQVAQCCVVALLPVFVLIPRFSRQTDPIPSLVLLFIISLGLAAFVAFRKRLERTTPGEATIREIQMDAANLRSPSLTGTLSSVDAALACAIFGPSTLPPGTFKDVWENYAPSGNKRLPVITNVKKSSDDKTATSFGDYGASANFGAPGSTDYGAPGSSTDFGAPGSNPSGGVPGTNFGTGGTTGNGSNFPGPGGPGGPTV